MRSRGRIWLLGGLLLVAAIASASVALAAGASRTGRVAVVDAAAALRLGTSGVRAASGGPGAAALASGHWQALARSPLGRRFDATLAWDGTELLEIGGTVDHLDNLPTARRDSGVAFDPRTGRWRAIAPAPAAVDPDQAASAWTGSQLFLLGTPPLAGGRQPGVDAAGLYDPSTDRWRVTAPLPVSGLNGEDSTVIWAGSRIIVAGTSGIGNHSHGDVLSFDPATDAWTNITPRFSARHAPEALTVVDTDSGLLMWSLWDWAQSLGPNGGGLVSGIDVLRLGLDGRWQRLAGRWPQHETVDDPMFTGSTVLLATGQIWCGDACSPPDLTDATGRQVDPETLKVTPLPEGPIDATDPQISWTGRTEIAFDGHGAVSGGRPRVNIEPGDLAFWDPLSRRWYRGPHATFAATDAPAVWDGSQLLVLSGAGGLHAYEPSAAR